MCYEMIWLVSLVPFSFRTNQDVLFVWLRVPQSKICKRQQRMKQTRRGNSNKEAERAACFAVGGNVPAFLLLMLLWWMRKHPPSKEQDTYSYSFYRETQASQITTLAGVFLLARTRSLAFFRSYSYFLCG